jgi:hypothetical protein
MCASPPLDSVEWIDLVGGPHAVLTLKLSKATIFTSPHSQSIFGTVATRWMVARQCFPAE